VRAGGGVAQWLGGLQDSTALHGTVGKEVQQRRQADGGGRRAVALTAVATPCSVVRLLKHFVKGSCAQRVLQAKHVPALHAPLAHQPTCTCCLTLSSVACRLKPVM
jgi:hypothetical protein